MKNDIKGKVRRKEIIMQEGVSYVYTRSDMMRNPLNNFNRNVY